ncbi:sensor histidine kinase [Microcella sp.]|uniref:sensor histidine kinase n=1 Tax=Microcella sp. TaxID=1913979 RepID=UPI00256DB838|nr:sensor domain-containing protein [Microcella sp.]MBX9471612.1 sensor domain-containing protein [Microcella sp.]
MTTTPSTAATPVADSWSYGSLWRRVPRALGYLIPTFLIAIAVSAALTSLLSGAVSLLVFIVGIYLVALTLLLARYAGQFEIVRLRLSGESPIAQPVWPSDPTMVWWKRWLRPLANGRYWLSLLHGAVIAPIIATLSFVVLTIWFSFIAVAVALPIRLAIVGPELWAIDSTDPDWVIANGWLERVAPTLAVVAIVLGVIALVTLPYVLRGMTWLHAAIARPFLGRFTNEQLEQQVSNLFTSRQAAVAAEGSALSRIERDIHDGPQQRLIRLQMDLAAAERRLADGTADPAEATSLIQDARRQAQDALDELRNLSRGFAPPLLLDRGLFAALESLATRSSIPVTLETELGATANLPDEVARNAYFVASELIANAAKHSQAGGITLSVTTADGALVVAVTDDGVGGAVEKAGHGLVGLRDRAAGMGGDFTLSSPEGGPTSVTVTLPLAGVGAASTTAGTAPEA